MKEIGDVGVPSQWSVLLHGGERRSLCRKILTFFLNWEFSDFMQFWLASTARLQLAFSTKDSCYITVGFLFNGRYFRLCCFRSPCSWDFSQTKDLRMNMALVKLFLGKAVKLKWSPFNPQFEFSFNVGSLPARQGCRVSSSPQLLLLLILLDLNSLLMSSLCNFLQYFQTMKQNTI